MNGVIIEKNKQDYPWILFLHGWNQNKESLLVIAKDIRNFANSVLIDLPGFGEIDLSYPYDIEDYLLYIKTILKEHNIIPSLIIGHSFGGKLAVYYSLQVYETPILLLSPSIISRKVSFKKKILMKIKPLIFLMHHKRIIKKIPSFYKGSQDYQRSEGYLRSTLVRMVHRYPLDKMKEIKEKIVIFLAQDDHEIPNEMIIRRLKSQQKVEIIKITGNHFAYRRHHQLIASKAREIMEIR